MSTILVVDDMPICREAVAEILRAQGFEVICASDGCEAILAMQDQPVDLVLLDVMMPKQDGVVTLKRIRTNPKWRDTPVIFLTDDAQKDTVANVVKQGAQGYILKATFKPVDLVTRVKKCLANTQMQPAPSAVGLPEVSSARGSSFELQAVPAGKQPTEMRHADSAPEDLPSIDKELVLKKIRQKLEIHPVPPVLQYIISQTQSNKTSIHDVVNTLRKDQALALRIMKVANSAYYAPTQKARDLTEAAARIGMSGIRNAVIAIMSIDHFASSENSGLDQQWFWEHALGTASLAQSIAESLHVEDPDEVFLAGLLHDIGRLVLSTIFPEEFQKMVARAEREHTLLLPLERETFGLGHDEVTREVLSSFGLVEEVVTAARLHELNAARLADSKELTAASIVALANRMAHALVLGSSGCPSLHAVHEYAKNLSLGPGAIGSIARKVVTKMSDTSLFFAAQGDTELQGPFLNQIDQPRRGIRLIVIGADTPNDPLSLFFEQMRWLDVEEPEIAVLYCTEKGDCESHFLQMERLEEKLNTSLKPLLIVSDASMATRESVGNHTFEIIELPAHYRHIVNAVERAAEVLTESA